MNLSDLRSDNILHGVHATSRSPDFGTIPVADPLNITQSVVSKYTLLPSAYVFQQGLASLVIDLLQIVFSMALSLNAWTYCYRINGYLRRIIDII